jgi:glycine/D-amino acid oxidase-like deaminating enzyme
MTQSIREMELKALGIRQPLQLHPNAGDGLPNSCDVVVIGGGIVGSAAALEFAEKGLSVVLLEKGLIGGEQSSRNWGRCGTQDIPAPEIPLLQRSLELWRGLSSRLEADCGYRECGTLNLIRTSEEQHQKESWFSSTKQFGIEAKMLSKDECRKLIPAISCDHSGGMYTPRDGKAEPSVATALIAAAAARQGAVILTGCSALGIEMSGGEVSGIMTERGLVRTRRLLIAAGIWSSKLLRAIGVRLPQLGILASVAEVEGPIELDVNLGANNFGITRRQSGKYVIACGRDALLTPINLDCFRYFSDFLPLLRKRWKDIWPALPTNLSSSIEHRLTANGEPRVRNPPPYDDHVKSALQNTANWIPVLKSAKLTNSWAGVADATPDGIPVISSVPHVAGLVVATGFSGHGFGMGLGGAELATQILMGKDVHAEISAFSITRFQ